MAWWVTAGQQEAPALTALATLVTTACSALADDLSGGSWAGGSRGGGAAGGTAAQRHNVEHLAELDYYVRKRDQGLQDGETSPKWLLPYAKAGQATALSERFASLDAYLDAMQAATALEFQASVKQALEQAERERRYTGGSGFHTFVPEKQGAWVYAGPEGDVEFEQDSWGRHVVEVEETRSYHIAVMAKEDEETGQQVLVLLPTVERGVRGSCRMRSLGYVGPFLAQYDSAQELRYHARMGTLPSATRALLDTVFNPASWRSHAAACRGTLRPASAAALRTDTVPLNSSQRSAVLGLRGGLDVIHGPPGTGKSTTIFHIIDSRVQPDAQVLVTCTRNQAVDSVVDKVSLLDGGILVFGNPKRLGPRAAQHTIDARVEGHAAVVAWKRSLDAFRAVGQQLEDYGPSTFVKLRFEAALRAAVERCMLRTDFRMHQRPTAASAADRCCSSRRPAAVLLHCMPVLRHQNPCHPSPVLPLQDTYGDLGEVAADAVVAAAGTALPALRAHIKRQLLDETRVFVCTIDATARMANELQELEVRLGLDSVIVDEAGCVLESAIPLLLHLHPANLVLVGDHKQLQAFSALFEPPPNHCRSLMERCVDAGMPATLLAEQYRMHPDIAAAISAAFYGSTVRSAPCVRVKRPCSPACRLINVSGKEALHTGAGFSNQGEAEEVVRLAEAAAFELAAQGVSAPRGGKRSLFIVTLYNKQRGLILDLLKQGGAEARLAAAGWEVAALSADACQGSKADLVVLSTVRNVVAAKSSGAPLSRFFNDARRINVALSRARHLSIIVGSAATLRQAAARQPFWRSLLQHYRESLCKDGL
ncbi:hypothetical protein ABPG75_007310 [Micractinium tetrahymenae]